MLSSRSNVNMLVFTSTLWPELECLCVCRYGYERGKQEKLHAILYLNQTFKFVVFIFFSAFVLFAVCVHYIHVNIERSINNVYVLCKFIDTIPAAKGSVCAHIKINLIKKGNAPHWNKCGQKKIDNKNIYNLALGVVMDFRVYFEPIMLPLKVSCGST